MNQLHRPVPKRLLSDLKFAAGQQVMWLLLMLMMLDHGQAFRWSVAAMAGFWLGVLVIATKRLDYSLPSDRTFIRYASIPLAMVAIGIEPLVHHYTHWAFVQPR